MEIVVNAAMSADGKLSTIEREQVTISGPADFARVDELRAAVDAVMVGVGTVLADDPRLGLDADDRIRERRAAGRPPHPTRVVADSAAKTPVDSRVLDESARSIVLVSESASANRLERLEETGATVIVAGGDRVDLTQAVSALSGHGIERLMVEGGGELIYSLLAADLVDDLRVFIGNCIIGGATAPTLADGAGFTDPTSFPRLTLEDVARLDEGLLVQWSTR